MCKKNDTINQSLFLLQRERAYVLLVNCIYCVILRRRLNMKKLWPYVLLMVAILTFILLVGCTKEEDQTPNPPSDEYTIYFGGYYEEVSKGFENKQLANKIGCYWKLAEDKITREDIFTVGEDVDLSPWIYVKNDTVYYVGTKSDGAYYWTITSSEMQEHLIQQDAEAWSIDMDENNSIYIAGQYSDTAYYWVVKDGEIIKERFLGGSDGIHIVVSNGKIFVAGRDTTDETQIAYCWIVDNNNEIHEVALSDENEHSTAVGAFLAGDGRYYIAGTSNGPCYWVVDANNYSIMKKVDLATDDNDQDGGAIKIFVDENGVVYVAGYSSSSGSEEESHSIPVYWIDYGSEIKKHVLDENLDGWATAIWATKDKLYISGQYSVGENEEETQVGCYWVIDKNNNSIQKHDFDKNGTYINSIYVAE